MSVQHDRYQGFVLGAETQYDPSLRAMHCFVSASDSQDALTFALEVVLTNRYARIHLNADSATESQASEIAVRWAHGLVDTETWESNDKPMRVLLSADWDPSRNSARPDDDIIEQLLGVFARMDRISANVDYAPWLDVTGFADVIGVPAGRIRGLLATLATRGWIEPFGYEKRPVDGNARITRHGYTRLDAIPVTRADLGSMMQEMEQYLALEEFTARFPKAWSSWEHAMRLLSETPRRDGIIGYACREAMQAFAAELTSLFEIESPPPPDQVSPRIRLILSRSGVSQKAAALDTALVDYWSKTFDLTQRQAKNALREGEELTAADARRVVMYTALVMYEVAQSAIEVRH